MEIWQILFCLLKTNLRSQFKQLSSLKFDVTKMHLKFQAAAPKKQISSHKKLLRSALEWMMG
jgi:hypothetical protein